MSKTEPHVETNFAEAWARVRGIDGWLTEGQARMLYDAAASTPPATAIVEIGSHHGRSTVILGRAKRPATELVAVDPFDDPRWGGGTEALAIFDTNLARHGLTDQVQHVRSFGADAGRQWRGGPVGLLFVDGAHDYRTVLADLRSWVPHLAPGACVLMHDAYSSPGVTRAAFAQFFGSSEYSFDKVSRSLVMFRRHAPSAPACVENGVRMLGRMPWLVRNVAIKLALRNGWSAIPPLLGHHEAAAPY
jgi:predicted O-methyltransferase YrrM